MSERAAVLGHLVPVEDGSETRSVPISKEQLAMLLELDRVVSEAAQRRDLMISALLAGHGLTGPRNVRLDPAVPALVVVES